MTALLQLYDKWVELMEEGKLVGIMMIDQSTAFELCDHEILKKKSGYCVEEGLQRIHGYQVT